MSRSPRRRKRIDLLHHDIPTKANRILHLILIALILIALRSWHLAVIQYDQKLEESRKPQKKMVIEPATRATIRDRFNLPLAINKITYQATILYSQLREIPSVVWEKDDEGKRIKIYKRKEYIKQLSQLLGKELELDPDRIEDLIYSKASYYAQVPFVIKEEVSEPHYYRLKMMEKDWPGIHMRLLPKRIYPRGRVAADIIGYMGAINRQEYEKILSEMKALDQYITEGDEGELPFGIESMDQARQRLKDLQEKAYSIHDYVGKTGIEGVYEEKLRGFYGKKSYYSDSKGNYLHELPGYRAPLSGQRVLLTISAELQEYAEQLLAQNEEVRQVRKSSLGAVKKTVIADKSPWIKGGGIVVMDPTNGEIITLASYPRFDPNDFISSGVVEEQQQKKRRIHRWFETEGYLANIWDQQQPIERERFDPLAKAFYDEKLRLSWEAYLGLILPKESPLREAVNKMDTLGKAISLQNSIDELRRLFPDNDLYSIFNLLYTNGHEPFKGIKKADEKAKLQERYDVQKEEVDRIKLTLDRYWAGLSQNYDKVLLVDLSRLAVDATRFSSELYTHVSKHSLEDYRTTTGSLIKIGALVKEMARELFHDHDFKSWRQKEEKAFLKQKRMDEKAAKIYPKPYIDYFDQQESLFFNSFWDQYQWDLLTLFLMGKEAGVAPSLDETYKTYFDNWHQELKKGAHQVVEWKEAYDTLQSSLSSLPVDQVIPYLMTIRSFHELNRPLLGSYRYLRSHQAPLEKHLAMAFYPAYGYGYGRSHAYRQATIQGSLFKIVTAYAALTERLSRLGNKQVTMKELNPLIMVDEVFERGNTRYVGYTDEGQPIPQLYKGGRLPRSLAHQHSGRVDLLRALEVSSNPYFSLLAGECLDDPNDLADAARLFSYGSKTGIDLPGEISGKVPEDLETNRTGLYAMAIGQHSLVVTPLQTAVMLATLANGGKVLKPKIVKMTAGRTAEMDMPPYSQSRVLPIPTAVQRTIEMPDIIRQMLLKGLRSAALKTHQESLASLTRLYKRHPEAIRHFTELKGQLLGKTSTSESVENLDLDLNDGTHIYTHVWFGCISFPDDAEKKNNVFLFKDEFSQPELIVVVYLRYGGYGKEAAPLAAQIVKKWREINLKK